MRDAFTTVMGLTRAATALLAVALLLGGAYPLAGTTPVADADTVAASDMLLLTDQLRTATGAPAVPSDPRLVTAAQAHANYDSANGVLGHYETAGLPYYTGYAPRDRVAAAGLTATFVSEVATSYGGGLDAVRRLWDAPYHRLGLMHPNATLIGWGHSDIGTPATVGDIVYDFSARPVDFVRSPADGQTGIPTSWSGQEWPDPLPAGTARPVGYPIVLVYSAGRSVDLQAASVVAPDGSSVPLFYPAQQFERDYQVVIPQRPLAPSTTYRVRFDVSVSGVPATNTWSFTTSTTGGPSPFLTFHSAYVDMSPYPTLAPAATAQVTLHYRNTGTATWQRGVAGSAASLGIAGDDASFAALGMNAGWSSANRLATQSEAAVPPGSVATFSFTVRAPSTPGSYRIPVRPVIDGVTWMDDQGGYVVVISDLGYHSHVGASSPYPTLAPGASATLFVQFTNTGSRPWVKGVPRQQANLGVSGDATTWSSLGAGWLTPNRVAAQSEATVAPGGVGTFTFAVVAPATPGVYRIDLRPVIDGTTWMEDEGVFFLIAVRG